MLSRGRITFIILSLTTVMVVSSLLAATAGQKADNGEDSPYKYLGLFTDVLSLVDKAYVDEIEMEKLMSGAFEGATDALDPFSIYVPANHFDSFTTARGVGSRRSGLLVVKDRGVAYAMAVEKGSPADNAGIKRGDVISVIQDQSTREIPLYEVQAILAGPVGTKIKLETLQQGIQNKLEFELEDFPRPGVELSTQGDLPVLTLGAFDDSTPDDVAVSLSALMDDGSLPRFAIKDKLILDLRSLAGGSVESSYKVASLFATGDLGSLKRKGDVVKTFDTNTEPTWKGRLVVLIDRGSQGPAEVLANVLRQTVDATLVGTFSFGYTGRLSPVRLSNGGRLLITDAFYTGPDKEVLRSALEPDVLVRPGVSADGEPEVDTILEKGLDVLRGEEEVEKKRAA